MEKENFIILNKISIIDRCLDRVLTTYENNPENLEDFDKQDIIVLNLQRACQSAIDMAMHICKEKKLGLPQSSGDAFIFLSNEKIITPSLANTMKNMVNFRNIAVHDYQEIDLDILQSIVEEGINDFARYIEMILKI